MIMTDNKKTGTEGGGPDREFVRMVREMRNETQGDSRSAWNNAMEEGEEIIPFPQLIALEKLLRKRTQNRAAWERERKARGNEPRD
jgi:hypothetical protein